MKKALESRTDHAKRNMVSGIINRLIILVLGFIVRTAIIYVLGAEYLGLGSLFTSIIEVLNMAELGFSSAVIFSLYKPIAENDTSLICELLSYYRKIYKIVGLLILGIGVLIIPFVPVLIKSEYPKEINIYILFFIYLLNTTISYLGFAYRSVIFVGTQQQNIVNNVNSVVAIIKYCFQFLMLIIFANYYLYIVWNVLFTFSENFIIHLLAKKYYPNFIAKGKLNDNKRKKITTQVKGLAIGQLCKVARNSFDSIVLSMYTGLITVAIYSNYYYVFSGVMSFLSIIVVSISAGVGNSIASEPVDKNYEDFLKFYYYFSWIGGIASVCMICLYQPFMELWVGVDLMAPFDIVLLFVLYFYVTQMGMIRSVFQNATGIWWEGRWLELLEMLLNLILNFVLGYFWGMKGILIATIITIFSFSIIGRTYLLHHIYFKKSIKIYFLEMLKYIMATVLAAVSTYFVCMHIKVYSVIHLLFRGFTAFSISFLLFALISCLNKKYRMYNKMILNIIHQKG